MCWPLSSITGVPSGKAPFKALARPPIELDASKTIAVCPAWVAATAVAMPAQPAPMMAIFMGGLEAAKRLHLPRQPELAQRSEADALVQHLEVVPFDFAQQVAVNAGHHQPWLLGPPVRIRQQGQRLVVQALSPLGLELHQGSESVRIG